MDTTNRNPLVNDIRWRDSPASPGPQVPPLSTSSLGQQAFVAATCVMSATWVWVFVSAATSEGQWDGFVNILVSTALMAICAVGVLVSSIEAIAERRRYGRRLFLLACVVSLAAVAVIDTVPPLVRQGPCTDFHGRVEPCGR